MVKLFNEFPLYKNKLGNIRDVTTFFAKAIEERQLALHQQPFVNPQNTVVPSAPPYSEHVQTELATMLCSDFPDQEKRLTHKRRKIQSNGL